MAVCLDTGHAAPMLPTTGNQDPVQNDSARCGGDECSKEAAVTSEVPQGSVLATILFLPIINNLTEHVNAKC